MNYYSSNNSIVEQSGGRVQVYMNYVYGWMTVGLILTGIVAWFVSNNNAIMSAIFSSGLMWVLILAEFGLVFVLSAMINRLSGTAATTMFMLYSVLSGLSIAPIFLLYTSSSIASVFFITAGMFAALSAYGYTTKRDLSNIGRFLFMGLVGIVIASLVNIFLKSTTVMWVVTYIGVFVFAGLTATDTQKLKDLGQRFSSNEGEEFRRFSILGALILYLDFINLFLMLLRILGDRR